MPSHPEEPESGNAGDFIPSEESPPDPVAKEELLRALENQNLYITFADKDLIERINSSKGESFFWQALTPYEQNDLILVWDRKTEWRGHEIYSTGHQVLALRYILQVGGIEGTNIFEQDLSNYTVQIHSSLELQYSINEIILRDQAPYLVESTFIGDPGLSDPNKTFADQLLDNQLARPIWEFILDENQNFIDELANWLNLDFLENNIEMGSPSNEDYQDDLIDFLRGKKVSFGIIDDVNFLKSLDSEERFDRPAVVENEEMDLHIIYAPEKNAIEAGLKGEGFQFISKTPHINEDTADQPNKIKLHQPINLGALEKEGDAEESARIVKYIDSQFSQYQPFKLENPEDYKFLWKAIFRKNPDVAFTLSEWFGFELRKDTPEKKELLSLKNNAFSDRWTKFDGLGYQLYAKAITDPIIKEVTQPPIAIAIQAPWGQGKTSLMRMIQEKLDRNKPAQEGNKSATFKDIFKWMKVDPRENMLDVKKGTIPTVWFNPLYYQNSEQIWAGLAHTILKQLSDRLTPIEREKFWFYLQLKRIDTQKIRVEVHKDIFLNFLPKFAYYSIGAIAAAAGTFFANPSDLSWTALPVLLSSVVAAGHFIKEKWSTEDSPLYDRFKDCVQEPDYDSKMGFLHFVDSDLKRAFELLLGNKPFAIFIDDLDRCPPETISEIILAINQFLSVQDKKAIFFLGMDMQMVAEALEKSQGKQKNEKDKIHASGKSFGWDFMDKFIQLPFFIPKIDENLAKDYMSGLLKKGPPKTIRVSEKTDGITSKEALFKRVVRWIRLVMGKSLTEGIGLTVKIADKTPDESPFAKMVRKISHSQKPETLKALTQEVETQFEGQEKEKLLKRIARQELSRKILESDNLEQLHKLSKESRDEFEGGHLQFLEQKISEKSSELLEDPRENELEELVQLAIEELDYNPRTVKRFLNLAKLLHNIHLVRGSEGDAEYDRRLIVRATHLVLNWPRVVRWLQDGDSQYQINGEKLEDGPAAFLQGEAQNKTLEQWSTETKKAWGEPIEKNVGDPKFYRFLQKINSTSPNFPEIIDSSLFTCHAKLISDSEDEDEFVMDDPDEDAEAPIPQS